MLQILNPSASGNLLETVISGTLTTDDYARLTPVLESKIKEHGKINWYIEMKDFTGWNAPALWEDLKLDVKHFADFKRIAMVGDKTWQEWLTNLMKPFTSAEVKFFEHAEKDQAERWVKQA